MQIDATRRRAVAALMPLEPASLAAASTVHLVRGEPRSGIPEAVILAVLATAAVVAYRGRPGWRGAALGAVGFAIAGFALGLSITANGGRPGDIAYHATVLP